MQPLLGNIGAKEVIRANATILVCMLYTAFNVRFNASKFFTELKDNTVKRYNTLVGILGYQLRSLRIFRSQGFSLVGVPVAG